MMNYKGYIGKVDFDDDANIFHGEVINLRDVITFQGESVQELRAAFQESVDDYLEFCALRDEEPEKYFFFMEENQGVSHWAVLLNGNDDPPVLLRYNDPNEDWHLVAHSFSDWMYALIWDSKVAIENRDFVPVDNESAFATFTSDADEVGPETFCNNTGFRATHFFRVRKGDRLFTCYR